jgi:hypothetical protein
MQQLSVILASCLGGEEPKPQKKKRKNESKTKKRHTRDQCMRAIVGGLAGL